MNKFQNVLLFFFLLVSMQIILCSNASKSKSKKSKNRGFSLLELIKKNEIITQEEFDSKLNQHRLISNLADAPYENVFLSTKTKAGTTEIIVHTPYKMKESHKMRNKGIVSLLILLGSFMVLRYAYNGLKKVNLFLAKGMKLLARQIFLLFFCLSIFIFLYTYGAFDKIYLNWEYLIKMISSIVLYWIGFNFFLILISLFVNHKWKVLEQEAKSFEFLKTQLATGGNKKEAKECFEFLILKRYFCIPLFPVLNSAYLRKELEFSYYLEQCLLSQFKQFFKLSWTCWFSVVFVFMFYNVFINNASTLGKTIFFMVVPLLGIILVSLVYFYCSTIVYRRIIPKISTQNMANFKDYNYYSNEIFSSLGYPIYLEKLIENNKLLDNADKYSFTIHE
ncbi:MAG: hypothetical protein MJ252_23985 [archaeon]|nr:hypothetical protein [archaeon]